MTLEAALPDLAALLRRRGAHLAEALDVETARARAATSAAIAEAFPAFEFLRDTVLGRIDGRLDDGVSRDLLDRLVADGILTPGPRPIVLLADAERYVRGGWLEEHIGLSALAAGADEVRIGQQIDWTARGFRGENEIDTIARFGERLVFVSAKAMRSRLARHDARHRERLMAALQEADNLVDHFGDPSSAVALVVTTDLWDEARRSSRYEQLHGKAAALGVTLVTLETVARHNLVETLGRLGRAR